jgi:hypothetical protein
MSINAKATPVPQLKRLAKEREVTEATPFGQRTLREGFPGLTFALRTVATRFGRSRNRTAPYWLSRLRSVSPRVLTIRHQAGSKLMKKLAIGLAVALVCWASQPLRCRIKMNRPASTG